MGHRKAAAAARASKARSRGHSGARVGSITGRIGANGHAARKEAAAAGTAEQEALVVTHWFDPGEDGEPYSAKLRLTGRRIGIRGTPKARDSFTREETVDGIVPGSGPVSISTWTYGLQPGEWTVTGHLVRPRSHLVGHGPPDRWSRSSAEPLSRAQWSWGRWALSAAPATAVKTRWALLAPLAMVPAVLPGTWTALGALSALIGFVMQAVMLAHESVPVTQSLVVSLLAVASGSIGAKLWYAVLHPGPWRQALLGGWALDGLLFVAPAVALAGLLAFDLPIGPFLDASAPGLFVGLGIARVGCFFVGCCAGRCTRSRWGVWSSDRRVGARRIPAQFLESAASLSIGVAAALLVLGDVPRVPGLIFVAAFGAYVLVRQSLLRLRAERRDYLWRRSSLVSRERR